MGENKNKRMRIGADAGGFNPDRGVGNGIERLISGFLSGLNADISGKNDLILYRFGAPLKENGKQGPVFRTLPSQLFSSIFLPLNLIKDRVHLFLGFSGVLPPFVRNLKIKSIVFLHDFGFIDRPQFYGNADKMRWETEYSLYGADKIIVFSDHIKSQLAKRFPGIRENRIVRIYPGSDHMQNTGSSVTKQDTPFFLFVGVIKPAKNIGFLLALFDAYLRKYKLKNDKLVLVGNSEEKYFKTILESDAYRKIRGNIEFINNVDDGELAGLYRRCKGLLNVSYEEGFCYPVAEAMTLGTPIIVNDIPLYRELKCFGGNLTITDNKNEFISAMYRIRSGNTEKTPVSRFKWRVFSKQVMEIARGI